MISRLEVRNFRMMRANAVSLGSFVVLVGKNATGKSTLLAALRFVSDLVKGGVPVALANALERESPNFSELCFEPTEPIEFALELDVLDHSGDQTSIERSKFRYEVRVGPSADGQIVILQEYLRKRDARTSDAHQQMSLWKADDVHPVGPKARSGWRTVVRKNDDGRDYFQDENTAWNNVFRFGPERSALGSLPEDADRFPLALRVRDALRDGISVVELDSAKLRDPSPPRSPSRLLSDGSNLARAAQALQSRDPVLFADWIRHVGHAIEGLDNIELWERPEDKRTVLRARFRGSHLDPVPSWLLSDGTLRLLAITFLSYGAEQRESLAMIEEPENGLHPLAMQVAWSALNQPAEGGQVLVATHSPVFLAQVSLLDALVFRRQDDGSALIRRGTEVPELKQWKSAASIADIFATGVLS